MHLLSATELEDTKCDNTIQYNKRRYKWPLFIETYHEGAKESSPYVLTNSSVLSRLQNVTIVYDMSHTVSEIIEPETAKLCGPYHSILVRSVIK